MSTKEERIRELEKQIPPMQDEPDQTDRDGESTRRLLEAAKQQRDSKKK